MDDGPATNPFLDGLRYIEDNLLERFTVADVARVAGYSAAVEVERIADVPQGLTGRTLPGGRFAVFTHKLDGCDIGAELKRTFGDINGM